MHIQINGALKEFNDGLSLNQIIEHYSQNNKRVIAEVNGDIIKQPRWSETTVRHGDTIELVSFVGGG